MIKTLTNLFKQDKEKFVVPKGVQDVIPVAAIFDDGIFKVGKDKYSKTYRFTDINYAVASREDKEAMFLEYSELLNSLDSGATTKITINNRRLNRLDFEQTILIPTTGDNLDEYLSLIHIWVVSLSLLRKKSLLLSQAKIRVTQLSRGVPS